MKTVPSILPSSDHPLQVFLSSEFQVGKVLAQILVYTGPARIIVSTFSTGEEFLRRMVRLRGTGMVRESTLYLDHKAAGKTARILPLARAAFDHVRFCSNHSKIMVIYGDNGTVSVLTSQNQTHGIRLESYVVVSGTETAGILESGLENLPYSEL